jgi:hypothetical protein
MVRTFAAAAGAVLAAAAAAAGQGLTPVTRTVTPAATTPAGPFAVPGTPVGRSVQRVGQSFAPAGQPAGTPIGYTGPGGMPVTTARPAGRVVDLSNLAAPVTAPLPPGRMPAGEKSALERLFDRWAGVIGIDKPKEGQPTNWTPGISRRNRARNRLPWIWD